MPRPCVLEEATAVLSRTPAVLDAMLRGLPDDWLRANEGDATWSPFDVVGHLIHGERTDWIPRALTLPPSARWSGRSAMAWRIVRPTSITKARE